jgi:hypothetical protein
LVVAGMVENLPDCGTERDPFRVAKTAA